MQMKVERRKPTSLYRKRAEWQLLDNVPIKAIVKYAALTLIGFLLFQAGQAHALAERGYEALGGEAFALFLPVLYWVVGRVVQDTLDAKGGKGLWR
ncbi:MAG: hypothetical protein HFE91_06075 [Acutalibacter sp.]|jgi:hypothetical protein|uniref:hypothetical protein n=1 Tax=Acutalibacter sp. TaxID=1918636 RepID=UPI0021713A83|nr:hypothetical protein [Acutalibacter sp.]MCI9225016.1 hypothetical protein [Acutalibacter sp.]